MTKIALIGRPNVGKSSLFNAILGKRLAIVDPILGTTRDPLRQHVVFNDAAFTLIDTAGLDSKKESLTQKMLHLSLEAAQQADILFFIIDGLAGVQLEDRELLKQVKKFKKPLYLLVNKIDDEHHEIKFHAATALGIKDMFPVSALHKRGLEDLFDALELPKVSDHPPLSRIKLCLLGKPNVGKSTLINAMINESMCLTDDQEGTTRDLNCIDFTYEGQELTFIDTAGLKKTKSLNQTIEIKAQHRTQMALELTDVALLMVDVNAGLTTHDKKIAQHIEKARKPCLILLNKWDLTKGFRMEHTLEALGKEVPFLKHCPALCISALKKRNIDKVLPAALKLFSKNQLQIPTSQLNSFLELTMQKTPPPVMYNRRLKIFYLTQTKAAPISLICFCNSPQLMSRTYKKFLTHQIRRFFQLEGCFFTLILKGRSTKKNDRSIDDAKAYHRAVKP